MKKHAFIILFILLFASTSWAGGMLQGVVGGQIQGWTDNFDGGSGNLADRTGWGTDRYLSNNGVRTADFLLDGSAATHGNDNGMSVYILADYAPTSTDYYVQMNHKVSSEASYYTTRMNVVRGKVDSTGLTGYELSLDNNANWIKLYQVANGTGTQVGAQYDISNLDWTTYQTVRLAVSGTGATVTLEVFLNGVSQGTRTDTSAGRIVDANHGGIVSYWGTGYGTHSMDNFIIGY